MDADAEEASGGNNMLMVSAGDSAAVVPVESATSCSVATARPKRHRPPRTAYNDTLNQRLRERAKKGEAEALEILQRVRALQRGVPVVAGRRFLLSETAVDGGGVQRRDKAKERYERKNSVKKRVMIEEASEAGGSTDVLVALGLPPVDPAAAVAERRRAARTASSSESGVEGEIEVEESKSIPAARESRGASKNACRSAAYDCTPPTRSHVP
jgi:hypothetical protein